MICPYAVVNERNFSVNPLQLICQKNSFAIGAYSQHFCPIIVCSKGVNSG